MRLTDISLNNLKRRKSKMLFLVLGLLIGVSTVVTLVSVTQTMHTDIQNKIDQFGANIVVTPKSDDLALSYGGVTVSNATYDVKELHTDDAARIKLIPLRANIANVAPKLVGAVDVGGSKVLLVGVDFPSELRLKKWWEIVGQDPAAPDEVLLGYNAATRLSAMPGSTITINGRPFKVAGTLKELGSSEDDAIFADLGAAQQVLGKPGAVSLIEVSALCKACPVEDIVQQISMQLPDARVSALAQAVKSRQQTVDQLTSFSLAISLVVLLIGGLVVLTTMMSSVNERTREIGIFRAIGFRRTHIARIILFEALLVSLLGGVLGWFLGMLASTVLAPRVAQLSVVVEWNPLLALGAVALAVSIGLAGSIYPALRAASLDPAEALRFI
jgi:putative ABC transport system permease protein